MTNPALITFATRLGIVVLIGVLAAEVSTVAAIIALAAVTVFGIGGLIDQMEGQERPEPLDSNTPDALLKSHPRHRAPKAE